MSSMCTQKHQARAQAKDERCFKTITEEAHVLKLGRANETRG